MKKTYREQITITFDFDIDENFVRLLLNTSSEVEIDEDDWLIAVDRFSDYMLQKLISKKDQRKYELTINKKYEEIESKKNEYDD